MNKKFISLACFVFLVVLSGNVSALTNISSCGTPFNVSAETYVLTNDINASGTCFTIGADNITFDGAGHTITGDGSGYGVYLSGTGSDKVEGVTVKNLIVKNFSSGIYHSWADNNLVSNITAVSNGRGIDILNSWSSTIKNVNASNNADGIYIGIFSGCDSIINNTINSNTNHGLNLDWANCLSFISNNTINSNGGDGIHIISPFGQKINSNTIKWNNNYGIYYSGPGTIDPIVGGNIYNNFFNNTNNFYLIYFGNNNWNTALQAGPNIIGGPYFGGNVWAKPDGTGFSDTCVDSEDDGICDSSYSLATGNIDYLPLISDSLLPTISVTSPQNATYDTHSIDLNVSADMEIGTWIYSLNGGVNTTFTPNKTITAPEGLNSLVVFANNTRGKRNSSTVYFTIETTPPTINITSPLNETMLDTPPDLNLTIDEPANITYSWDSEGNISGCRNCTSFSTTYGENNGSDAGLAALWHLNENFGTFMNDQTSNGNNGNIVGAAWNTGGGYFGGALEFDGDGDYVNISYDSSLDVVDNNGDFTFYVWFKLNELPSTHNRNNFIFAQSNLAGSTKHFLQVRKSDNRLRSHVASTFFTSTGPVVADKWYFVALTFNGSYVKMYIDGVLDESSPQTTVDFGNAGEYLISYHRDIYPNYFNGSIDEVAVYNRALSASEISELYAKSLSSGQHSVTVYANDTEGNPNSTTMFFTFQDTTPPTWVPTPSDQTVEANTIFFYDVNAFDPNGIDIYFVNDTVNFAIGASDGIITNNTALLLGTYDLNISVNDTSGNAISSVITITVQDIIDIIMPTVKNSSSSDIMYGEDEVVAVDVYDLGGIDTVLLEYDSTINYTMQQPGLGNTYNLTIPAPAAGIHKIRYYVNDTAGNMNRWFTDSFEVGLVSHWPMDEGAGTITYDVTSKQNDGDLGYIINPVCGDADGPDWTTSRLGSAVQFDGCNDYVNISANSSLNIRDNDNPHTVLAWFKVNQIGVNQTIISQANGNGTGRGWITIRGSSGPNWSENEIVTVLPGSTVARSNVIVEPDTWYFVAVVYNESDMVVFVDGIAGEAVTTTVDEGAIGDIHIGTNESASGEWFNGTIDEVRILNRALTEEEIEFYIVYSRTLSYLTAYGANQSSYYFQDSIISLNNRAQGYMDDQNSDGSWSDLTYSIYAVSGLRNHYARVKFMAQAYSISGHSLYHNESLKDAIERGLGYIQTIVYPGCCVNENGNIPGNWYFWDIAAPMHFSTTLILIVNDIDSSLFTEAKSTLEYLIGPEPTFDGANLVWDSTNHMRFALIDNDIDRLNTVRDKINGASTITNGNGIQEDYSYHFHGKILYTAGYGAAHLNLVSEYITFTSGTSFQISDENLAVHLDYGLEGVLWAIQGVTNDLAVLGRTISQTHYHHAIMVGFLTLTGLEGQWQERYIAASKQLIPDWEEINHTIPILQASFVDKFRTSNVSPAFPIGHRHYYRSDHSIHRRPDFYVSVKMLSDRMIAYESMGLNKKGWHLSDGMTYITINGFEYYLNGVRATLDWLRLPGTTVERFTPATGAGEEKGTRSFVGGVQTEDFGLAAMDFKSNTAPLVAKKSYFFFDEEVVALGTGISSNSSNEVETVINQWPLSNDTADFVVNGTLMPSELGWNSTLEGTNWAHSDNIGYYFPAPSTIYAIRENRSGKYSDLGIGSDTLYYNTFLTLTFDHGTSPDNSSYAYAILPNKSRSETEAYSNSSRITVINQTNGVHAVADEGVGATGIVFWEAGKAYKVEADQPCLVFIQENGSNFTLAVSEPTQQTTTLKLIIDGLLSLPAPQTGINLTHDGAKTNLSIDVSGGKTSTVLFSIDKTLPTITIASPENTTYNTTTIDLQVSADEPIDTWWYEYSANSTNITFTPNETFTAGGADGLKNITVYANNTAGNMGSQMVYFTIDSIQPIISINSPQNATYSTTSIDLNVSADEPIDTWIYNLNSAGNIAFTPNTVIAGVDGLNSIVVYANDTAGNANSSTIWFSIGFPPAYSNLTPGDNSYTTEASQDISIVITDEGGINETSLSMNVSGNYYDIGSAKLTYNSTSGLLAYYSDPGEFTEGQVVSVVAHTEDNSGNQIDVAWKFTVADTIYSIPVIPGWNMISIPLELYNWSITSVLASIEGNYTDIYAYVNGMWYWDTSLLPFFKLTDMAIEQGYWINVSSPDTLELGGTVPSSTTISVTPGWNLVGYPSFKTRGINNVLRPISYSDVYTYINGTWYWDTSLLPFFVLTEMTTGQGYWISATSAGSYDVRK